MIFISVYAIIVFWGVLNYIKNNRKLRLISCLVITIVLAVIMGFRRIDYAGADTLVYARDFQRIVDQNYSISDVLNYFDKDYFFYILARIFSYVNSDVNVWLFVCSLFYIGAVSRFIYKYSGDIFLSYIIFVSWQFYLYNFQLVRHCFSLAFVIISVSFILDKKKIKYLISIACAAGSQVVSLIALPLYWYVKLSRKKILQILIFSVIFIAILLFSSRSEIIGFIFKFKILQSERFALFSSSEGGSLANFAISSLFVIIYVWLQHRNKNVALYKEKKPMLDILFAISLIGVILYSFEFVIDEFYRVAQYFSFSLIVLIPTIISIEKDKVFRTILILLLSFFLMRHFFGGFFNAHDYNPYYFYWE